jgi:ribonuclease HI
MAGKFYAVKVGKTPGIYNSWDDCKAQTDGFSGAVYKSFKTAAEAAEFMGWGQSSGSKDSIKETSSDGKIIDTENDLENVAYVDGSYNVATGEFSYGVVMFHNGQEHTFSKSFADSELATMRNVAGEIKGAEAAMEYAYQNGMKSLTIYHDYEGIAKWPLRDWAANKEGTKAYQDFYDNIKKYVDIKFVKVKGHSGDKYNDLADKLAKEALGI